jgi:hypothetical protein
MNRINSKFYLNKILQIASELKYQLPLTETEFEERGCGCCGARARFPGPCADCAELELARLIGADGARSWAAACREEQRLWKSFSDCAAVKLSERREQQTHAGKGFLEHLTNPIRSSVGM